MVIHTLKQDYQVIYRKQQNENFEILSCRNAGESSDTLYTLLRFIDKGEICRLLEQNLLMRGLSETFSDYRECFIWNDSLIMVFLRKEGETLRQWLEKNEQPLSRRLQVGKHLLERLLLLNMPEYLLHSILNAECILVTEMLGIEIRYEPSNISFDVQEYGKEIGACFYELFVLLFKKEAQENVNMEIYEFLDQIKKEIYKDIFHIYQIYDWMQDSLKGFDDTFQGAETWLSRLQRFGKQLLSIGEKLMVPVLLAAVMIVLIYGICHPASEEAEEVVIEQIGTLQIQ